MAEAEAEEVVVETTRPAKKRTQKLTAETEYRQKKVFLVNGLLLLVSWRALFLRSAVVRVQAKLTEFEHRHPSFHRAPQR